MSGILLGILVLLAFGAGWHERGVWDRAHRGSGETLDFTGRDPKGDR